MRLNLIYARARNGVIGRDGTLPWHVPEDLAHFKRHTAGCPVIMGRKTWDSLPPRFRPLPGRTNIVVTRQSGWQAGGAVVAHSLQDALACAGQAQPAASEVWVIGGAQIYAQALPLADELVVTEIDADIDGDAFAPAIGPEWQAVARQPLVAGNGMRLAFVTWRRTPRAAA